MLLAERHMVLSLLGMDTLVAAPLVKRMGGVPNTDGKGGIRPTGLPTEATPYDSPFKT